MRKMIKLKISLNMALKIMDALRDDFKFYDEQMSDESDPARLEDWKKAKKELSDLFNVLTSSPEVQAHYHQQEERWNAEVESAYRECGIPHSPSSAGEKNLVQ